MLVHVVNNNNYYGHTLVGCCLATKVAEAVTEMPLSVGDHKSGPMMNRAMANNQDFIYTGP